MIEGLMLSMVAPGTALSSAARTGASLASPGSALAGAEARAAGALAAPLAAAAGLGLCAQAAATAKESARAAVMLSERFMRLPGIGDGNSDHGRAGKVQQFCHGPTAGARRPSGGRRRPRVPST